MATETKITYPEAIALLTQVTLEKKDNETVFCDLSKRYGLMPESFRNNPYFVMAYMTSDCITANLSSENSAPEYEEVGIAYWDGHGYSMENIEMYGNPRQFIGSQLQANTEFMLDFKRMEDKAGSITRFSEVLEVERGLKVIGRTETGKDVIWSEYLSNLRKIMMLKYQGYESQLSDPIITEEKQK